MLICLTFWSTEGNMVSLERDTACPNLTNLHNMVYGLAIVYIYLVTKYMILRVCYSREIISYISLHRHYSRTCEALTFNHVYDQNILGMSNSAEITCL